MQVAPTRPDPAFRRSWADRQGAQLAAGCNDSSFMYRIRIHRSRHLSFPDILKT
jgi:hypothetical protein